VTDLLSADSLFLAGLFLVSAILYGSVGHAGASAYLAAMALTGVAPEVMKPTALVLNIGVASIVTLRFWRAGFMRPASLVPFLAGSVPAAADHLSGCRSAGRRARSLRCRSVAATRAPSA